MKIDESVALVTGGNRGLGRHFVTQLIERGAKVYAAARDPETVDVPGAIPLRLDITAPESVAKAAEIAADVTLLINNAGISTHTRLIDGDFDQIRREMETHFDPAVVTSLALDGIAAGTPEILADDRSRVAKRNLSAPLTTPA